MASLRFLHAADMHLGRPFSGFLRSSADFGPIFRRAGYGAWKRMVERAVEERIDFVALAGDIFHDTNPPVRARAAFKQGLETLYQGGIPVYLALGNHDPLRSFPETLRSLPGLHVFAAQPHAGNRAGVEFERGVKIFGASFERSAVTENLVGRFSRDPGIDCAIGVVHTNVSGSTGHRNYAPCTLDDLRRTGMNIWCLGHVHSARILWQDPLIVYAGASQGAHALECGPKGCWLVTVEERGRASAAFVPLAPVRWENVEVEATGLSGPEDLLPAADAVCAQLISEHDRLDALVLRMNVTGERPLWHGGSFAEHTEVREMLSERLASRPVPVFLESLSDNTRSRLDLDALADQEGFLGDLLRFFREAKQNPDIMEQLQRDMRRELARKVSGTALEKLLDAAPDGTGQKRLERLLDEAAHLTASTFFDLSSRKD